METLFWFYGFLLPSISTFSWFSFTVAAIQAANGSVGQLVSGALAPPVDGPRSVGVAGMIPLPSRVLRNIAM